ncbi:MAG: ABC transporter permease, partial [Oscillospiraceae bacterium]
IQQYGAMRAVGMDTQQMTKMIAAEAATYAMSGCMVGCVVGLLLSKLLYDTLITTHFAYAIWSFPVIPLAIILLFVLAAAVAAVYAPAKRIRNMAVTDTINEL